MNKTEFMEGIHLIQNAYNQKFSTEKLKLYYENLQDMDKEQYIKNIKQLIKDSEFVPNIAQIRNKKQVFSNYEKRDYSNFDFTKLYANVGGNNEK